MVRYMWILLPSWPVEYWLTENYFKLIGGGWVFGDLGSESAICERLQERLPIVIVDVDYHLCPGTSEDLPRMNTADAF